MSQSRQLAAIMFTDIVGYTALMGEDEQAAFELLKKNRSVQRPLIEKFNGRWLKEIGDGVLASFSTVSDAVNCAKEIQETCQNEPDLSLRIGIHLGEVVFEGNDVFGDGVNIASRLEPLAPVGGILVSESVHRNLGNKKNIVSTFLREEQLKNVKEPIKVYQVQVVGVKPVFATESSATSQQVSSKSWNPGKTAFAVAGVLLILLLSYFLYSNFSTQQQLADAPPKVIDKSIAVIPFKTITKDSSSQYIAEGVREAILNSLFKIDELEVGSRTSAEIYRNSLKTVPEIARELGVANILEGSAQKFGDKIRITVQLIDGKTDNHLWSEEYDRDWGDIFAIYTEIAENVAAALQVVITPEEIQQIASTPTTNVNAYDYILQARQEMWKYWSGDKSALRKAEKLYEKVLDLDPNYARGWVHKGEIYFDRHGYTNDFYETNYLDSVLWYCDKAIELDPETGIAYHLKGMVFHKTGNIDLAIENYKKALVLSQDNATTLWEASWRLGYIYIFRKDVQMGISLIRKAVKEARGSPQDYRHMIYRLGQAYMFIGAFEEADNYFTEAKNLGGFGIPSCSVHAFQGNIQASLDCTLIYCPTDDLQRFRCNYLRANYYLQLSEFEKSAMYFRNVRKIQEVRGRYRGHHLYREGFALIKMGYQEEGMKLIEEQLSLLEKSKKLKRSDGYDYHFAAIYAFRGNKERVLHHLENYRESVIFLPPNENLIPITFIQYDIMFENLRDDPEFKTILKQAQEEQAVLTAQVREMEERGELDL